MAALMVLWSAVPKAYCSAGCSVDPMEHSTAESRAEPRVLKKAGQWAWMA